MPASPRSAAIVLAGGRSQRMGVPKAWLEWHGSTLLRRAVGIVAKAVDGPVVVVAARGQSLPELPAATELAEDARDARGPLQGLLAGLTTIGDRADVVYLCGVDAPLLHPAFVRVVVAGLSAEYDAVLPDVHDHLQPLAAAYRVQTVALRLAELLEDDHDEHAPGTGALLGSCRVRDLDAAALLADPQLARLDPDLDSLINLNTPVEYEAARARPAPAVTVVHGARTHAVRAATLGAAAIAVGARLDAGDDAEEPLAGGDLVTFVTR